MRSREFITESAKLWSAKVRINQPNYVGYVDAQVWAPNAQIARTILKQQYQIQDHHVGSVKELKTKQLVQESVDFEQMQPQQIIAVAQDTFAELYPDVKLYGRSVVEGVGLTTAKGQAGAASAFAGSDTVRGAFYLTLNAYAEGNSMIVVIEDATAGRYKGAATAIIKSLFEAGERLYKTQQRELVVNDNANAEAWSAIADRVGAEMMESAQLAEGPEQSLSSMVAQDQAERNEYSQFVKSKAGGDWNKGAKMYAQLKKRPSNDIFNDAARLNQFMKMTFDFDNFTDQDWNDYWLLAQHCDDNRDFQKKALAVIKKYQGQNHSHYKYLYDRISCGLTGNQKYGTQDICGIDKQGVTEAAQDAENYTTAYHITDTENAEEIVYGGLRPTDGKAFLVVDTGDQKKLRDELYTVAGWMYAKSKSENELTLLQVDITDIPLKYEFGWNFSLVPIPADRIQDLGPDALARYV
jgi:hypothetical protein